MVPSIFTDELRTVDTVDALPILKSWGLRHLDFRGRIFGTHFERLTDEQRGDLRNMVDEYGFTVSCLQSSLAKVHLPDAERQQAEAEKLEQIIRAADAFDCRLVRSFFYWQPKADQRGSLAVQPDQLQLVLDMFGPLAERAKAAGLTLAFENCGVTPDEVFTVLDALDVPAWGMAWDPHNSWRVEEWQRDEDAFIDRMLSRTHCLHVKARYAVPGIADNDDIIPYDKILRAYKAAGITGPVSAETHNPHRDRLDDVDVSKQLVEAIFNAWPGGAQKAKGITRAWEDNPVNFVVVGLGMGRNRSRMIQATPGAHLLGVCDLNEERAKQGSEEFGIPYKTDLNEWLQDERVDVVYVVTETGYHAKIGLQALEAGKHVIVTKPMEASLAACDALIAKAEEKGLLLAVDFSRRFDDSLVTIKAAADQGIFGQLFGGNSTLKIRRTMDYFGHNKGWRGTRELDGGGVLSNQSIHHIDEIAFIVGVPDKVRANVWTQTHDIEAEDLGTAVWLYETGPHAGTVITFTGTTSYPHKTWYNHFELDGTKAAFSRSEGGPFGEKKEHHRWYLAQDEAGLTGHWQTRPPVYAESEWMNSADNMAAAIRTGAPLVSSGHEGRATQSILDAMYCSAYDAGGDWVAVDK